MAEERKNWARWWKNCLVFLQRYWHQANQKPQTTESLTGPVVLEESLHIPLHIEPIDISLQVLYEDEDLLVVNKPPGLIVHPCKATEVSMLHGLFFHVQKSKPLTEERPAFVHRLDKLTSGALLAAKNLETRMELQWQFQERTVHKEYLTLVNGEMEQDADTIVTPIWGKDSETSYQVVVRFPGFSLLRVYPKTGRTHQIRIHLCSVEHPVVVDRRYGFAKPLTPDTLLWGLLQSRGETGEREEQLLAQMGLSLTDALLSRQALHAYLISFTHPRTQKRLSITAPLSSDFRYALSILHSLWPHPAVEEWLDDPDLQAKTHRQIEPGAPKE